VKEKQKKRKREMGERGGEMKKTGSADSEIGQFAIDGIYVL